jgi:phosphoglycolate phosphatase-like HAD superfamily hydrolase
MIILFDVDGVLVDHRAYRESIRKTTAYFSQRLGLGRIAPDDDVVDVFESQSITVEWETDAILAAALLLERLRADAGAPKRQAPWASLPPDFWEALDHLPAARVNLNGAAPDLAALARRVGGATQRAELPSRAALRLFSEDVRGDQRLPAETVIPLLAHLLANVYDVDRSPAMQIHQNHVLGDEQYTHYYQLAARVTGKPLLLEMDRPLLAPAVRDVLLERRAAGEVFPVIYTARPSLAPVEAGPYHRGFTPESEIARAQVGLDPVPAMGFGKMNWLAPQMRRLGSDLVKPSPVHGMAAIAAARTGQEVEAIKAALAVERGDHLRYPLTACAGEAVHVFEDSPSSLRAVTRAVELLNRQGLRLSLTRHGIAPPDSPKHAALAAVADVMHGDVSSGVRKILGM